MSSVDHYAVLGVPPEADVTIIKRRYRQLVREHHPDAVLPERRAKAHEQMQRINAAWTVLSDPAERARYDRDRKPATPSSPKTPTGPARVETWVGGANGYNQSDTSATARAARHAAAARDASYATNAKARSAKRTTAKGTGGARKTGDRASRSGLVAQVFEAAEMYFFHGRASEAIAICQRVLKLDPRNAEAAALMGDIYAEQGRLDVAVQMYVRAVESQPENGLYRQKLETLRRARSGGINDPRAAWFGGIGSVAAVGSVTSTPGRANPNTPPQDYGTVRVGSRSNGSSSSQSRSSQSRRSGVRNIATRTDKEIKAAQQGRGFVALVLASIFFVWMMFAGPEVAPRGEPPLEVVLLSSVAAVFLGIALPQLGLIRGIDCVGPGKKGSAQLMGIILVFCIALAGLVAFPVAVAFYALFILARGSLLPSLGVLMMLAAALAGAMTMHITGDPNRALQNVLVWWCGRSVLPALLGGWALGSLKLVK